MVDYELEMIKSLSSGHYTDEVKEHKALQNLWNAIKIVDQKHPGIKKEIIDALEIDYKYSEV